ncbi:siderophore-interacting protein [Mangrovicella endophytica]|uniref:siderophore-interacting protein n=1 Tax=Mangrovicella endophytica TaxID=2066697 RepID=UPI0018E46877|nr:siderophore-interacting protein [Mangrovicella endophytica]
MLKAQCDLAVPEPEKLLTLFCEHYSEYGMVRRRGAAAGHVTISYGRFALHAAGERLSVRAKSPHQDGLTYVKMGVVHHLREFMGDKAPPVRWLGDGQAGGTPSFWREMQVVESFDITPSMRRVVLTGPRIAELADGSLHVRLFFPPKRRPLRGPVLGEDGCPVWPEGEDKLTPRVYTIREVDAAKAQVAIDILRHDGDTTAGSFFAVNAKGGDAVGMAGPLGDAHPAFRKKFFFFGDETAIPAIDRILRRLPAETQVHAVIEVANPSEEQVLRSDAALRVDWLHRDRAKTSLADAAAKLTAEMLGDDGYVWAGCEFADFQAIRRHCRKALGLKADRHHVVAYWRKGARSD